MKLKVTRKKILIVAIVCAFILALPELASAALKYELLESFPGFFSAGDSVELPAMILAIYKFGIWTVGIAGLFMITVGGIMYMGSAGNNAIAESAKKIITDSLLGIIVALSAYLFLYVINPDLTVIKFSLISVGDLGESSSSGGSSGSSGTNTGSGSCETIKSGPCSVENLSASFGSSGAETMSKICNKESRGNTSLESQTDLCKDGNSFSIGLFQVNLMTSAGSIGCDGSKMFTGTGSRSSSYDCNDHKTNSNGVKYCAHRNCTVTNKSLYEECKAKLKNGTDNISVAKKLYSSGGVNPWKTSAKICGS